ncbi:MAG: lysine 2,3-aminomutase [Cyanobacteria bacterium PR.3.49]|nr:lysine 2,3-aminomutase [Cyanobacteria bacterium PR.3.49]
MVNIITGCDAQKLKIYSAKDLDSLPQTRQLSGARKAEMKAVASVLPFRVNNYVVENLIDWKEVPDDPIFQLTFPQPGMLEPDSLKRMLQLTNSGAGDNEIMAAAREIQLSLNPHPAGQKQLNVPKFKGESLDGMQHKYRETVLFFPSAGQTCFSYCTYCFRWPQFVGMDELKFASKQAATLVEYLKNHKEVKSVLFTGGDPLIMKTVLLRTYIEPLLTPELEHVTSIRIGTKAPAFWPYRFVTDDDSDDLMRLFEQVKQSGRNLALMAHYSHPRFLETDIAENAIKRIQSSGATIRCQSPVVRHVNDNAKVWSDLWSREVKLGAIPYYMFVERDTGARRYFEIPLEQCLAIFNAAYKTVSGLGRTVRGPSMSCTPGKVMIDAISEVAGEKVFVLKFIQARDPAWVNQVFFAKYDPHATWLNHLEPALGKSKFFFEEQMASMLKAS